MTLEEVKKLKEKIGIEKTVVEKLLADATRDKAPKENLQQLKKQFDYLSKQYETLTKQLIELSKNK